MRLERRRAGSSAAMLFRYMLSRWDMLTAMLTLAVVASYAASLPPVFIRYAVDLGVARGSLDAVLFYSLASVGVTAASGLLNFVARYVSARYSQEVVHRIRLEAFDAVLRQYLGFFDRLTVGQLISRITNDSERVANFLSMRVRMIAYSSMLLVFATLNMTSLDPRLAAVALVAMLATVVVYARYSAVIRPLYDAIRQQLGVLASIATSDVVGIKTIKGLNIVGREVSRFDNENRRFVDLNVRAARVRANYETSTILIFGLASAAVLLYGGYAIERGELTVGGLTMFLTYVATLSRPMNMLGSSITDIQRALASGSRLFEIIGSTSRVVDRPGARELADVRGEVEFVGVSFTYPSGRRALRNVNLRIRAGEKVLVVGPPGSGKSTLLKLLLRFYDPDEGRITMDGVDVGDIKLQSLRRWVGYVPQEPFIFSGTVFDNIALGNPGATLEDVVRAARIAKIHDFIASLPRGYQTVVGERGINLSGGQRQRIAIARALVRDPKILLLDDPVANLDAETEKSLVEDLKEVLRGRTAIIVTQRLSLVPLADRIVVLNDGEVVEEGTHEELMSRRGLYYRLYTSMVGGEGE
jgi:ATP-binding cassette subfamily B protein